MPESEYESLISEQAVGALSDEALGCEIARIIVENEETSVGLENPVVVELDFANKKKLAFNGLMHVLRFASTDYRYRSDLDTFEQIAEVSFIHLKDSKIASQIFDKASLVFWLTDGFNTYLTTKDAVYNVCMHPDWQQGLSNFIRKIITKKYPPLLSGMSILGMIGAGFQGYAGTYFTLMRFSSIFLSNTPSVLNIVNMVLSTLVGLGSAFNFFVYQIDRKAMSFTRIRNALKNSPHMTEYIRRNFYKLVQHHAVGGLLAIVWTALTAEAIFFINDSFELTPFNISIFIPIVVGNIPLRIYITNYNYLFSSIKEQFVLKSNESIEIVSAQHDEAQIQSEKRNQCIEPVKLICRISAFVGTLGAVIALAGPIFRVVMIVSGCKKTSEESDVAAIIAFAISFVLACLSYGRDIKLWGTAGDTLFKKPKSINVAQSRAVNDKPCATH